MTENYVSRSPMRDTKTILISSGASQGFVAILYLLGARHVGPSAFGTALSFIVIGNFISSIVDFGQNSYMLRELAASRITRHQVLHRAFTKSVVATLVAFSFGFSVYVVTKNLILATTLSTYVVLLSLEMTAQSILRWTGGAGKFSFSIFCDKGVSLLAYSLVLAANFKSEIWIPISLTVGSLVGLCVAIILNRGIPRFAPQRFSAKKAVKYVVEARSFGLLGVVIALQGLDVFALQIVAGAEASGAYASVSRWIMPFVLISASFSQATYTHFAAAKDHRSAIVLLKSGKNLWIGTFLTLGVMVATAPLLVGELLGPAYSSSVLVLRVLCLSMVVAVLNQPIAVLLQARGKESQVTQSVGIGIVLQILSTIVLGYFIGAVGGSCAWLIGQSISFVLLARNLRNLN